VNRDSFLDDLFAAGEYSTPDHPHAGRLDRWFGRSDVWCYARLFWIVFTGWVLAKRGRYTDRSWAERALGTLALVEACHGRLRIEGVGHLDRAMGAAVYVANHMSLFETFALPAILMRVGPVATVVKEGLLTYPLFGPIMRATRPIAVTRRNPRQDLVEVLTQGEACLRAGRSVLIFPQATRSVRLDVATFNTLGAKLARKAGVPLVPVALRTDFMGIGRWCREIGPIDRRQTVRFRFGEPLRVTGSGKAEHQRAVEFIVGCLNEWGLPVMRGDDVAPDKESADDARPASEPAVR
jgi:1-acyl-sn-glycerol-3-phosphate acyltransferase